jgi:predicted GH43/DUF377 family glycosyl hydrolase
MTDDRLIFTPADVDLSRSPLRRSLDADTFVLGAFNPGLTRLPSGNLLLMVRVAEALKEPADDLHVHAIRWVAGGYRRDAFPRDRVDMADPRQFDVRGAPYRLLGLTSLSWLLPVELDPAGTRIEAIHYDHAIEPAGDHQQYGIEDPRIARVGDRWWMTTCSVSSERLSTTVHSSTDGLSWEGHGLLLDHQNKDMLFFEGLVDGRHWALTRPLGELYLVPPPDGGHEGGPSINLAASPDGLHWKPDARPFIRARRNNPKVRKLGGGTPPVLTPDGWLTLFHGVELVDAVGIYRTFWALLDRDDPGRILRLEDETPVLEGAPHLTQAIAEQRYLPSEVVFSTGLVDGGDHWLVASGEADLACRLTRLPKTLFL